MHKHLIFVLFISMVFPMLAACDAGQPGASEQATADVAHNADTSVPGKYFSEKHPGSYLELRGDGTFVNVQMITNTDRSKTFRGTYKLEDGQLTLDLGRGQTSELQLKDGVITNKRGTRWVKDGESQ